MHDTADAGEDPVHKSGELGRERRRIRRDDGHGLADHGCGVGHHANERAGVLGKVGGVVCAVQHAADLLHRDTRADGDEQFAGQCLLHSFRQQNVRHHVRLASQDDHIRGLNAAHVLILQHRHTRSIVLYGEFDALCGFGPSHTGDEVGGCPLWWAVCGGGCGSGVRIRG